MDSVTAEQAHVIAEQWKIWCDSKKYFGEAKQQNMLGRMMPGSSNIDGDGALSAELAYFNMAVHALVDMKDNDATPFLYFYWRRAKNIKALAYKLGIGRRTFYKARDRFVMKAIRQASIFRKMSEAQSKQDWSKLVEFD